MPVLKKAGGTVPRPLFSGGFSKSPLKKGKGGGLYFTIDMYHVNGYLDVKD